MMPLLPWCCFYELDDVLVYILRLRSHLVVKVGPVERALELLGANYPEVLLYVQPHLVGCGGRQGYHRGLPYLVDYGAYAPVLGPEVVAPLRYAVRLVDGIERYLYRLEELHVVLLGQRLGRDVQELGAALADVGLHLVDGGLVLRGVKVVGHAFNLAEVAYDIHLVLHQRNQGGYDYGRAVHQQRGQLVAQRLAAACGHEHESVVAIKHIADDGLLVSL